jgi:hypothetical protein
MKYYKVKTAFPNMEVGDVVNTHEEGYKHKRGDKFSKEEVEDGDYFELIDSIEVKFTPTIGGIKGDLLTFNVSPTLDSTGILEIINDTFKRLE